MAILFKRPLSFQWPTQEPFLFLAHHEDHYPEGNDHLGPKEGVAGRNIGQDFDLKNPWKMYHGRKVPGFPAHPHRGFETVTIVLEGLVDHFDSMGGSGRYGGGDVQWMTAGAGMQHCEMFPLVHDQAKNPLHLFQIWLNLPAAKKFVDPFYTMHWGTDAYLLDLSSPAPYDRLPPTSPLAGTLRLIQGTYWDHQYTCAAPDSWAADPDNQVAIYLIDLKAGQTLTLPETPAGVHRSLYFYEGQSLTVGDVETSEPAMLALDEAIIDLKAISGPAKCLYLAARPIGEPIAQYGPFVMNTREEIAKAYEDFEKTHFGGWPWSSSEPVHPKDKPRGVYLKE